MHVADLHCIFNFLHIYSETLTKLTTKASKTLVADKRTIWIGLLVADMH